jgi:chaperonin GroEL
MLDNDPRSKLFASWNGMGLKDFNERCFMTCKTFFANKERAVVSPEENYGENRISEIRQLLDASPDSVALKKRLAAMSGGVGFIRIGGNTKQEVETAKDVAEDIQRASFSALREGFIPGGGYPLAWAGAELAKKYDAADGSAYSIGYLRTLEAMTAPLRQIFHNACMEPPMEFSWDTGYDLSKPGSGMVDLLEAGIADTFDGAKQSLLAALHSVAIPYLMTSKILTNES